MSIRTANRITKRGEQFGKTNKKKLTNKKIMLLFDLLSNTVHKKGNYAKRNMTPFP